MKRLSIKTVNDTITVSLVKGEKFDKSRNAL